jgi:ligand-binding sensor domain-containing protein
MNGTTAYVSYTEMIAGGLQKIAAKRSSHWTTTAYFTTGSYAYADFSDIVVCDDVVYVAWQDVSDNNFQIYARRANSGFGMLGVQVKLTSSTSEPSRFPSLGARGGSGAYNGNVYLVWERGGDIYPDIGYYGTAAGNATTPYVNGAYYDRTVGSWLSENVTKIVGSTTYGGKNVRFVGTDNRYSRRPRIAKSFSGDAHVVYETEIAVSTDEYLTTPDTFALARDAVWDLSYTTDYSLTLAKDLPVSGSLPRKEIRFGDFSETISGQFTFGSFKYFTGDAVEPFDISLISSETQPVLDNRSFVAAVNDQGDAWIGTHKGLSFYFRSAKEMAHCSAFSSAIRAVAFDANNIMLVGTDDGKVYASYDHLAFTELSIDGASGVVTDIAVAPDNGVWVSTSESGIFRIETTGAFAPLANGSGTLGEITVTAYGVATGLPSNNVTRVKLDSSGTAWAATDKGLVKIDGSSVQVFDETNSAIPSARVNDVAIRDASTRYIATASGLAVMSGGAIEQIDIHDSNWNGNVKSVCFKSPNIIWAGTMSYLFQITADDGNYTWTSYDPSSYTLSAGAYDDLRTFYATGLAGMPTDDGSLVEVYVNNRPVKHGYALSKTEEFWAVQFASPLLRSDVVEIKIRTDITQYTSLAQNRAEQIAYGTKVRTVGKMVTDGEQMYVVTEGDEPGLLRYDHSTAKVRPYDKIGLDTTPPTGTLRFDKQIDRGTIQMSVPDAADNLSGIDSMKVANYDNFTSDGVTELPWVPFDEQFNHSLGFDLGLTSVELTISGATGAKVMRYENGTDKPLYAGTSFPARVYKYDATALEWNLVTTLDVDDDGTANPSASIEFMASYLGRIVVGTGDSGGIGKVYVSVDGENFSLLASIAGTHAYCATEFNDVLYIGTGGSGKVYTYDGTNIRETYSGLGTNVYGIAAYNNRVYLATGEQGRVYSIDPVAGTSLITHVDADSQVSSVLGVFINETEPTSSDDTTAAPGTAIVLDSTAELDTEDGEDVPSGKHVIFAGTANTSRVIKSENKNPFITSFVTVTGKRVPFIKVFNGTVYAAVGRTLLYYGAGAWLTKRSVSQDINDVFIDENDNIWIVTDSYLYASKTDITRKTIYLKLKDRAGNETVATSEGLSVSIEIEDLESFTHENRILELDEYGTPLSTYDGDSPFFSADKIETERGVFYSEIFNGTNDHVSWGTLYWDAVVPTGTDVVIGVRSAKTKASLLDEDWTEYTKDRYTGVDVSSFAGQFIQFRATLTSTVRGVSPSLYKVVITSIIKSSVHFFTTNFVLPSRVRKGIITSRKIVPVSADIVFGIDTNNSVDFADYQIVDENKVFTTAFDQAGKNIRVGVKLIAPTRPALQTDSYSEYDPYGDQLFVNVVDFDYTNSGTSGKKNFKVTFYGDYGRTEEVAVLDTSTSQEGWSVDGLPFPEGGYQVANGGTVSVICSIKGTSALRCNQYYYVTIEETADDVVLDDNSGFVSGCNTSFVDEMVFDFTNTALTSKTFHFRIRAYDEAERTTVVKTYSSTSSVVGWTVDDASLPGVGTLVTSGQTVSIGLLPDVSDLETDKVYYLTVDSFDGTTFESVSKSWTFRVNPVSSESCGEYSDVPVLKNFVIMFELEDGSTVMLNT